MTPTKEQISNCNACLEWLDVCNASCCRSLSISLPLDTDIEQLKSLSRVFIKVKPLKDSKWYFDLHDVNYIDGTVIIELENYKIENNRLILFKICSNLTKDNLCKGHPDNKPWFCKYVSMKTAHESGTGFTLTDGCLFKYKLELQSEHVRELYGE